MKNKRGLFAILLRIVNAGFWLSLIALLFSVSSELFTSDGNFGFIIVGSHHAKGYPIAVSSRIYFSDSTYTYQVRSGESELGMIEGSLYFRGQSNNRSDSLKKLYEAHGFSPETVTRKQFSEKWYESWQDNTTFSFASELESKGYLWAKSSNWFLNCILIINGYMGLIFSILIFHYLSNFFDSLRRDFTFSDQIWKWINKIGLLLISYVIIRFAVSIIFISNCSSIGFSSWTNGHPAVLPFNLNVEPRLVFDFTLFIIGLSLLGLSSLFRKGALIESENELTI